MEFLFDMLKTRIHIWITNVLKSCKSNKSIFVLTSKRLNAQRQRRLKFDQDSLLRHMLVFLNKKGKAIPKYQSRRSDRTVKWNKQKDQRKRSSQDLLDREAKLSKVCVEATQSSGKDGLPKSMDIKFFGGPCSPKMFSFFWP